MIKSLLRAAPSFALFILTLDAIWQGCLAKTPEQNALWLIAVAVLWVVHDVQGIRNSIEGGDDE
jgi:hypothetical protein